MSTLTVVWMIIVFVGHAALFGYTIKAAMKEGKGE